jgi:hypothetical protein
MSKKVKPEAEDDSVQEPSTGQRTKHFKEQFDDEETLLVFKKHPVVMRKGLIFFMLAILAGTIPALVKPTYGFFFGGLALGFVVGLILIFPSWVRWYFSVYIMTNKRFIQQSRSLFQVNVVDIGLEQVQMINYQVVGIQETLLNFGTIIVQTYVGDLVIRDVHRPARIQKKMVHELRELGIHPTARPMGSGAERVIEG